MLQTCIKKKMKMTNLLCVRLQERNRSKKDVGSRTALNFVVCPSQLGGTLCRLAQPIQKSLFRWKTLVRNGWVRHLVHVDVVVLVNMINTTCGTPCWEFFCHVSYFDEVALEGSHSLVTLHSIYYVTKPNSTTVHFWGSLCHGSIARCESLCRIWDRTMIHRVSVVNLWESILALVSPACEWTSVCGDVNRFLVRLPTWDLSEDLLEYIWSSDEQRVSVLIGSHQPIGVAQTKRVSVSIGSQLIGTAQIKRASIRHGSHRSHGSEEWVPHQRGHLQGHPWRRKWRLFVTGDHLFVISATCPLSSCCDVSGHRPFSTMWIALCSDNCLAQGQPVMWPCLCA